MKKLNIAICGAGPAGLAAAIALRREGHVIVVFDQFETPKRLGSGLILQPTGLAVLDWLGLDNDMQELGAPIHRLYGKAAKSGRVVLDVSYDSLGDARGLAVHRAGLFYVLHNAVTKAQIKLEMSSKIISLDGSILILDKARRDLDSQTKCNTLIRCCYGTKVQSLHT